MRPKHTSEKDFWPGHTAGEASFAADTYRAAGEKQNNLKLKHRSSNFFAVIE